MYEWHEGRRMKIGRRAGGMITCDISNELFIADMGWGCQRGGAENDPYKRLGPAVILFKTALYF